MGNALAAAWQAYAPGKQVPTLIGPDNGVSDAISVDAMLNASEGAMTAITFHAYWNDCVSPLPGISMEHIRGDIPDADVWFVVQDLPSIRHALMVWRNTLERLLETSRKPTTPTFGCQKGHCTQTQVNKRPNSQL